MIDDYALRMGLLGAGIAIFFGTVIYLLSAYSGSYMAHLTTIIPALAVAAIVATLLIAIPYGLSGSDAATPVPTPTPTPNTDVIILPTKTVLATNGNIRSDGMVLCTMDSVNLPIFYTRNTTADVFVQQSFAVAANSFVVAISMDRIVSFVMGTDTYTITSQPYSMQSDGSLTANGTATTVSTTGTVAKPTFPFFDRYASTIVIANDEVVNGGVLYVYDLATLTVTQTLNSGGPSGTYHDAGSAVRFVDENNMYSLSIAGSTMSVHHFTRTSATVAWVSASVYVLGSYIRGIERLANGTIVTYNRTDQPDKRINNVSVTNSSFSGTPVVIAGIPVDDVSGTVVCVRSTGDRLYYMLLAADKSKLDFYRVDFNGATPSSPVMLNSTPITFVSGGTQNDANKLNLDGALVGFGNRELTFYASGFGNGEPQTAAVVTM